MNDLSEDELKYAKQNPMDTVSVQNFLDEQIRNNTAIKSHPLEDNTP